MDREDRSENNALLQQSDPWDGSWSAPAVEVKAPSEGDWQIPMWIPGPLLDSLPLTENYRILTLHGSSRMDEAGLDKSIYLAEFVECRFVPEYVSTKRAAGRAHFRAILKHILTPRTSGPCLPSQFWKFHDETQGDPRVAVYGFIALERCKRGIYSTSDRDRPKGRILDANSHTHP